jgi:tetratricopeptide (TPR) repeat protein
MRAIPAVLMILFLQSLAGPSLAASQVFVETYAYNAGESDSKLTCRTVSLIEVKRLLLEKIGVYMESRTEIRDFQIQKDEVVALTAGIVKLEILDETWNGEQYALTAKIMADPNDIARSIAELRKQQDKRDNAQKLQQINDTSLAQIREMQAKMEQLQSDLRKLNQDAGANEGLLNSWGEYEAAVQLRQSGKLKEAIERLNAVIEKNPTTPAYYERGIAYLEIGRYDAVIADMTNVLEVEPDMRGALWYRGMARFKSGNRHGGRQDIEKAAQLGSPMAKRWLRSNPAWRD